MIDLKETKRVKELLMRRPSDFQAIIEETPLAICITDKSAHFKAVNENYCKLYGFERSELVGKPFTVIVPEENRQALKTYHDRFFVDKYEILRKWVVVNNKGKRMEIFADAGYNDTMEGGPYKITLIKFQKYIDEIAEADYANNIVKG